MKLSIALITFNEEENIDACLESVSWADEIVIVDSGSTDRTVEKAKAYTQNIFHQPFADFASQKNRALELTSGDWIFLIDADERITPGLRKEIEYIVHNTAADTVYAVKRRTIFMGHVLNYSGTQNDFPLRLFPVHSVQYRQPVHEEIVTELPVKKMDQILLHHTTRDIEHYHRKMSTYIPLELETMRLKGRKASVCSLITRPPLQFVKSYFYDLGILDGWGGFLFSSLSAYYTAVKYRRYMEQK